MDWLAVGPSCEAITSFSWLIGVLAGAVLDLFLIISIALTPPLREHGGDPPPTGRFQRYGLPVPPYLIAFIWGCGLWRVGGDLLSCYTTHSTAAAAIVVGLVMLPMVFTAAHHIARRSVPL
jgi:hypothetical protein